MLKRIFFILLPVLVIILGINGNAGHCAALSAASYELSFHQSTGKADQSLSFNFKKESPKTIRSKVRIKALDDFAAVEIIPPALPEQKVIFNLAPDFYTHNASLKSTLFSRPHLRGPPALA